MSRGALLVSFAALVSSAGVALSHEEGFPLPWLAPSADVAVSASLGHRPRQTAGERLALRATRRIAFDTDEGTWMSVDVAPDGRRIVFDLLGDLYALNIGGGRAVALTRGMAFDAQPTFSPDGRWIAFVSDRSGSENLWMMRADGSGARQVTFGDDDTVLVSPAWSRDGKALYASRYLWSVDNYELWRYGLDGSEALVVPIKAPGQPRDSGVSSLGAVVSPDGRSLYLARRTGTSSNEPQGDSWSIVRHDIASRKEETLVPRQAGAGGRGPKVAHFRPALSPDGTLLAYATRFEGRTGLRLRDLRSGADRWLAFPIEHDQMQARSWQDLVPRYAFTPDGASLILSRKGKLESLAVASGAATTIPFGAAVDLELGAQTWVAVKQETGPVRARIMQTPQQSPDGSHLAFSALGHVYVMALDGSSAPRRLTRSDTPEFHPSWSPDGSRIAYVTWTARGAGDVWIAAPGEGSSRKISDAPAFYTRPAFTPDGNTVVAVASDNDARLNFTMEFGQLREASLVAWPAAGGARRVIRSGVLGGMPHFGPAEGRVYLQTPNGLTPFDLASGEPAASSSVVGPGWYFQEGPVPVDDIRMSPDGRWVLALIAQQLHLLVAPHPGQTTDLSSPGAAHRRITDVGADFFEWADGGRTITWSIGSTFYRRDLSDIRLNPAATPDWSADAAREGRGTEHFAATVEVPRDVAKGSLLLRGARLITMRGDEVVEDADLLVTDGRIAALGARGSIPLPEGAVLRDVSGKTIVPGFIDVHDHVADIRRDVLSTDVWGLRARLAYGITTAFDPSSLSIDMLAYQDMVDAGMVLGSRVPTTGMAMFSFNRLASLDEARALLRRYRDHYRTSNVKQYLIGNRRQRQWLVEAAGEMGVMPTTEGSLALKLDLTQIIDGYAGSEHALPTPLYRDVIELVARSRTSYDATLQIANGGPAAQDNFKVRDQLLSDVKFTGSRPASVAAQSVQSAQWSAPQLQLYPRIGADAARIQRAGGVVAMGAHGEIPGVGFHWEMEAHVEGGMTPLEALRAGTIGGAEAIGRAGEFGSLEPGKYADLVILQADPRGDIRRSRSIVEVMKNGRLHSADSLDELWPRPRRAEPAWFSGERPEAR